MSKLVSYVCPKCGTSFSVPADRIPASGARGRCKSCGMSLTVFPDGLLAVQDGGAVSTPPSVPVQPPDLQETVLWEFRRAKGDKDFDGGPFPLSEVRQRIMEDKIFESDFVRVEGAEWAPSRSYPVLVDIFDERVKALKRSRGDASNCGNHPGVKPEYFCPSCMKHLCKDCVRDEPLMEGITRMICNECEVEVRALPKISLKKLFGAKPK